MKMLELAKLPYYIKCLICVGDRGRRSVSGEEPGAPGERDYGNWWGCFDPVPIPCCGICQY